ncbi:orotate phosphoribosyltransferase [Ornithinibacillus xuwenensis]|uniref:Orotate phosphoribosyltransferase n=1 Tax=Ornithinibacillus xuwenensis TaxID=3144668 RepID=A0ABU9XE28_9BACI
MKLAQELARDLLRIKAVQINPENYFTWTSGIKSPIYCDNRITMSFPEIRKKITLAFIEKMEYLDIKPDIIAGCATAGIPHAAWLADSLNLPMVYVRSKPKGHGKGNQIEGYQVEGKKVLVIEDLISTGGSALEAVEALEKAGAIVVYVLSIFTYGLEKATVNFEQVNLNFQSLTNYDELIEGLEADGKLDAFQKSALIEWRNSIKI